MHIPAAGRSCTIINYTDSIEGANSPSLASVETTRYQSGRTPSTVLYYSVHQDLFLSTVQVSGPRRITLPSLGLRQR